MAAGMDGGEIAQNTVRFSYETAGRAVVAPIMHTTQRERTLYRPRRRRRKKAETTLAGAVNGSRHDVGPVSIVTRLPIRPRVPSVPPLPSSFLISLPAPHDCRQKIETADYVHRIRIIGVLPTSEQTGL